MRCCSALTPARGRQQTGPGAGPGSRPWRWVLRPGASHVASFYRPGPEPPPPLPPPPPSPAPASPSRAPASSGLTRQGLPSARKAPQGAGPFLDPACVPSLHSGYRPAIQIVLDQPKRGSTRQGAPRGAAVMSRAATGRAQEQQPSGSEHQQQHPRGDPCIAKRRS
jgi:hypothetical protein